MRVLLTEKRPPASVKNEDERRTHRSVAAPPQPHSGPASSAAPTASWAGGGAARPSALRSGSGSTAASCRSGGVGKKTRWAVVGAWAGGRVMDRADGQANEAEAGERWWRAFARAPAGGRPWPRRRRGRTVPRRAPPGRPPLTARQRPRHAAPPPGRTCMHGVAPGCPRRVKHALPNTAGQQAVVETLARRQERHSAPHFLVRQTQGSGR